MGAGIPGAGARVGTYRATANRSKVLTMVRRSRLTIGALVAAASTGHVLYPAWLAWAARHRRAVLAPEPEHWPHVTALVAAYDEADCIAAKVRDILANGYPGPLDVMVVADGDVETAVRAEQAGATVVTADERLGKSQALNLGFSKVNAPVVVMSDANNTLAPGAIAALVRHLQDPRVGAVAGEKVERDGAGRGPVLALRVLAQATRVAARHDDRTGRRAVCHPDRRMASHSC